MPFRVHPNGTWRRRSRPNEVAAVERVTAFRKARGKAKVLTGFCTADSDGLP